MKTKHGFETSQERSDLMRKIKGSNTKPEILLRKALWCEGIRYRKSKSLIVGKPDIAIKKYKLAIFVDCGFWHGYKWEEKKPRLKVNKEYWIKKIEGNIKRDRKNSKQLRKEGWTVLRFWDHDINKSLDECVKKVKSKLDVLI